MKSTTMYSLKCFFLVAVVFVLQSCGGSGGDSTANGAGSNYLTGTWTKACQDNGGNTYITKVISFEGTSVITISDYIYGDALCFSDLLDTYVLSGNYTLGGTVTTTTSEMAAEINVTMTTEDGVAIPSGLQRTGYRIVYVDGDLLYGGDEEINPDLDGTTPAKRSNILETTAYTFGTGNIGTSPLIGTWRDNCVDNGDGSYRQETVTIGASTMNLTVRYYNDSVCSILDAGSTEMLDSTYSLGDSVITASGITARNIDSTYALLGVEITLYSLIYLDGSNLYFGILDDTNNGTSTTLRSKDVDLTNPSTKI